MLDNKLDPQLALTYADKSIQNEERFENLVTKSKALERLDKKDDAMAVRNKAFEKGTALQVHFYARGLQNDKRQDEAFAIFRSNARSTPTPGWCTRAWRASIAAAAILTTRSRK